MQKGESTSGVPGLLRVGGMVLRILVLLLILGALITSVRADELIPTELRDALIQRRESIKEWAITCPESSGEFAGQYSMIEGTCWQGDMTMFAGLGCLAATLAGDEETAQARCSDVARAQAFDGKWNRGPTWVDRDYPDGDFSRDQTRGVFSYLLAKGYVSQDTKEYVEAVNASEMWLQWIRSHDDKICPEDQGKCELGPGTYNLFYNVYRHLGTLPTYTSSKEDRLIRSFYRSKWYYRFGFLGEIPLLQFEVWRGKWYPIHLKASSLLIFRVQNMNFPSGRVRNKRAARVLGKAARRIWEFDPENPLYRLLYENVTMDLVKQILEVCPETDPLGPATLHDWAWQRHSKFKAWERADGHDCIYLINLVLARMDGKLNW